MENAPPRKWTFNVGYYLIAFFFFASGFTALSALIDIHNSGRPIGRIVIPGMLFGLFMLLWNLFFSWLRKRRNA
jgi:NADH:ubiquinone oxidoreductase subunit 3 (subunit A)